MNRTTQELLISAAEKVHNDWKPPHRDALRPTVPQLLRDRETVWAPTAEKLLAKYAGADTRLHVALLLDACGDQPMVYQLRQQYEQQARDQSITTKDTTTLGAVVSLVHQHQAPLISSCANQ